MDSGATLIIDGGTSSSAKSVAHSGYINYSTNGGHGIFTLDSSAGGTSKTYYGGLLTGGACDDMDGAGAITIAKTGKVELYNLTIAGNIAASGYGAAGAINAYKDSVTLTMNSVLMEYNFSENAGGAIYVNNAKSSITIKNSTIQNNATASWGGGIYVAGGTTNINLDNTKIQNNIASDCGGGVAFGEAAAGSSLNLKKNATISNNVAYNAGGGVYSFKSASTDGIKNLTIQSADGTGTISNNYARGIDNSADGKGGGIYVDGDNTAISGLSITNNTASNNGGGIYINSYADDVNISSCKILNNTARNSGGGIYHDGSKYFGVFITTITNNTAATKGAGLYTEYVKFSGTVTIQDNALSNGTVQDAYVAKKLKGVANYYSNIGITTPNELTSSTSFNDKVISSNTKDRYLASAYFSNQAGVTFKVKYDISSSGTYSYYLYRDFGSDTEDIVVKDSQDNKQESTDFTYTPVGSSTPYEVVKGYISHSPSMSTETEEEMDSSYYYSDGYFMEDSSNYNTHLSSMSLSLTMTGFSSEEDSFASVEKDVDQYTFSAKNIRKLYSDIGFHDVYICDYYRTEPHLTTFAWSFAQKELPDGNKLVTVVCRGAGYGDEWYSNVLLGTSGEHKGFSDSAKLVWNSLKEYIQDYDLSDDISNGNVKFWVTGYSRGAAVANITSKYIVDDYCMQTSTSTNNKVYAYCFSAPKGGVNSEQYNNNIAKYNGIHNVINDADIVPKVAMAEMGFIRYGVDHYMPGTDAGSVTSDSTVWSYVKDHVSSLYKTQKDNNATATKTTAYSLQRGKMLEQLYATNPTIDYSDEFTTATINIYTGVVMGEIPVLNWFAYDTIEEQESHLLVEDYEELFLRAFQAWGFYDDSQTTTNNDFLHNAHIKSQLYDMSLQEALLTVVELYSVLGSFDTSEIMKIVNGITDRISLYMLWDDVLGDWDNDTSTKERIEDLESIWKAVFLYEFEDYELDKTVNLLYYLTGNMNENTATNAKLKKAIFVLFDCLLQMFSVDYNNYPRNWINGTNKDTTGGGRKKVANLFEGILTSSEQSQVRSDLDAEGLFMLGTFANNVSTILTPHIPEVAFAWIRSYDSYYDNDKVVYSIQNKADYGSYFVTATTSDGKELNPAESNTLVGDSEVVLKTSNTSETNKSTEGALIQYRVKKAGEEYGSWQYYNDKGIELTSSDTDYVLQTRAVYLQTLSEVNEYTVHVNKAKVFVSDGTTSTEVTESALNGASITVNANDAVDNTKDEYEFVGWAEKIYSNSVDSSSSSTSLTDTTTTYNDLVTSGYDTYSYIAHFESKVTSLSYSYNNSDRTDSYILTKANGETVTSDYNYYTNVQYVVADKDAKTFHVQVTFFPDSTKNIYYSSNMTGELNYTADNVVPVDGSTTTCTYNPVNGSITLSKLYTSNEAPEAAATVIVDYKDANFEIAELDTDQEEYAIQIGQTISITAPYQGDEEFIGWSLDGTTILSDDSTYTLSDDGETISFLVNESETKLYGLYQPVVNSATVTAPTVQVDGALPASIENGVTVTITGTYSFDTNLKWQKLDDSDPENPKWADVTENAESGTTYKAVITPIITEEYAGLFTIADNVMATIDGEDYEIKKDENGNPYIEYIVTTDEEPIKVVHIQQPDSISLEHDAVPTADVLPSTIKVSMSNGSVRNVSVIWDNFDYTSSEEEQTIYVTGTVNLEGLYNPDQIAITVTQEIYIAGRSKEEMAESDKANGTYYGTIYVTLYSDEEDDEIYYSFKDSSTMQRYDGTPIKLEPEYEKVEDTNTDVATMSNDVEAIPKTQVIYAYVKGKDGITENSVRSYFAYTVEELPDRTVTYDLNGGVAADGVSYEAETVKQTDIIVTKAAPIKQGYTFAGWNNGNDTYGAGEEVDVEEDLTLTATWTANTYTIVFHANGGIGDVSVEYMTYDQSADLRRSTFTREGYTFAGWNTKADGTGTSYSDGQNVTNLVTEANGHITLYAQWKSNGTNPTPTTTPSSPSVTPTATPTNKNDKTSAKTNDSTGLYLWMTLLLGSSIAAGFLIVQKRKHTSN